MFNRTPCPLERVPPAERPLKREDAMQGERIKLLLVDDEEGYVNVLSNRMARRNIDVTKALSGTAGIQALRKGDFDVALVDLKMEDMDGIEVLKIFKKMDPRLKVVMLTGHGSAQAAREGIALGASGYLTKPCELEELVEKIRETYRLREGGSIERR
jgi:DNA-binding NtrC family response regulator